MDFKEKNAMMLIHDTSKAFKEMMRKKQEAIGIPDRYRYILLMLNHYDGANQLDIVKWTKLKAPTVSLTLQMMEEDGYIKRVTNQQDKRNTNIFLLDKGRNVIEKIIELIHETEKELFYGIPEDKIKEMEELLRIMMTNASIKGGINEKTI